MTYEGFIRLCLEILHCGMVECSEPRATRTSLALEQAWLAWVLCDLCREQEAPQHPLFGWVWVGYSDFIGRLWNI